MLKTLITFVILNCICISVRFFLFITICYRFKLCNSIYCSHSQLLTLSSVLLLSCKTNRHEVFCNNHDSVRRRKFCLDGSYKRLKSLFYFKINRRCISLMQLYFLLYFEEFYSIHCLLISNK